MPPTMAPLASTSPEEREADARLRIGCSATLQLAKSLFFFCKGGGFLTVNPLRLLGKYEPDRRRFFECALYGRVLCLRRAIFGLGRKRSADAGPSGSGWLAIVTFTVAGFEYQYTGGGTWLRASCSPACKAEMASAACCRACVSSLISLSSASTWRRRRSTFSSIASRATVRGEGAVDCRL